MLAGNLASIRSAMETSPIFNYEFDGTINLNMDISNPGSCEIGMQLYMLALLAEQSRPLQTYSRTIHLEGEIYNGVLMDFELVATSSGTI